MPTALLVYPEHPPSYWGADHALEMSGVKATHPPLGLLTVAAMFPASYELRVVDMNVSDLHDADLEWADLVFTSTMITQHLSLRAVVERCNRAGVPVVAGGPHPTTFHEEIGGVDHFVLDEVEETFPEFLRDLENGRVWLFCIDDFPPILRAFFRGRVPSGAIFGGTTPSHPHPHACSDDLPRREPPHGGLSPPPLLRPLPLDIRAAF